MTSKYTPGEGEIKMICTAILGCGTVGGGTAEVLMERREAIKAATGKDVALKYILDLRDFSKTPFAPYMVNDFRVIENDPEVKIVIETIGGVGAAYEFTRRSLAAGKSVVTSNKELVATRGPELMALAREHGAVYMFEASVGGGIPIIHNILQCFGGNRTESVCGIVNGTTNYILTQMYSCGQSFDEALADAQRLGYAERDPSADVDGFDACRKICILAALCFDRYINPADIPTTGISGISAEDMALAAKTGYEIKLLARSWIEADGRTAILVEPHFVPKTSLLAGISGVTNGIVVRGNNVGELLFAGPGAGKLPTASAVVSDVVELARDPSPAGKPCWTEASAAKPVGEDEIASPWFVRLPSGAKFPADAVVSARDDLNAVITKKLTCPQLKALLGDMESLSMYRVLD